MNKGGKVKKKKEGKNYASRDGPGKQVQKEKRGKQPGDDQKITPSTTQKKGSEQGGNLKTWHCY